jgi:hypothetical protein
MASPPPAEPPELELQLDIPIAAAAHAATSESFWIDNLDCIKEI